MMHLNSTSLIHTQDATTKICNNNDNQNRVAEDLLRNVNNGMDGKQRQIHETPSICLLIKYFNDYIKCKYVL